MTRPVLAWPFVLGKTVIDGRFLLKDIAGQGGMGFVYRVEDLDLERHCVLKMLAPKLHPIHLPQHDAPGLLVREAKTLSQLAERSDSFVTVFHRGTVYVRQGLPPRDGETRTHVELDLPYYVMELLHGSNLENLIDNYRRFNTFLPWNIVLKLSAQAARALCIAHDKDIVHRDIKPNNMFLHERVDRKPVVKYIDFGVSTKHGEPGVIGTGTKQYGSPELLAQSSIRPPENKQSDIYSLALVIYELAALHGPFEEHRNDYVYAHVNLVPPPLSARRADAPGSLVELLHAALAKKPDDRPTAVELATGLDAMRASLGNDDDGADAQIADLLSELRNRAGKQRRQRGATARANHAPTAPPVPTGSGPPGQSDVWLRHSVPIPTHTAPWAAGPAGLPALARTEPLAPRDPLAPTGRTTSTPVVIREVRADAAPLSRSDAPSRAVLVHDTDPDGEPLFSRPIGTTGPPPAPTHADEDNVPILSSMGGVFEGWEDDTWRPSPFEEEEEVRASSVEGPRPNSGPLRPIAAQQISHSADGVVIHPKAKEGRPSASTVAGGAPTSRARRIAWAVVAGAALLLVAGLAKEWFVSPQLHAVSTPDRDPVRPIQLSAPLPSAATLEPNVDASPSEVGVGDSAAPATMPLAPGSSRQRVERPRRKVSEEAPVQPRAPIERDAALVEAPVPFEAPVRSGIDDLNTKISP